MAGGAAAIAGVALPLTIATAVLSGPVEAATAAAPVGVGPTFSSSSGVVKAKFRDTSTAAGYAAAYVDTRTVIVAGTADGDFALARVVDHVNAGFGGDAKATTDFGADDVAYGLAISPDRQLTAVGSSGGDLAVARYTPFDGLDWSFDGDGQLKVDLGGPDDVGQAVLAGGDGSATVAGGNGSTAVVVKLLADGTPDPVFGTNGTVSRSAPGPWRAAGAAPDGALLLAGGGGGLTVAKLSGATGAPDATFGDGGTVTVLPGAGTSARAAAVQSDGRILVAGTSGGDAVVVRLLATGVVDPTFGVGGVARLDRGGSDVAYSVLVADDGRILVAGDGAPGRGLIAWLDSNGTPEPGTGPGVAVPDGVAQVRLRAVTPWSPDGAWFAVGFNDDQLTTVYVGAQGAVRSTPVSFADPRQTPQDFAAQADGKLVLVGATSGDIGMVRFHQDGSRDPSFGRQGFVQTDAAWSPTAVVIQPGGRIVVAGAGVDATVLVGFRPDGAIDTSFGDGGRTTMVTGWPTGPPADLVLQPDGKLVVAFAASTGGVLARLDVNGRLDPTFGTDGMLEDALPVPPRIWQTSLAVQTDGRILATGGDYSLRRFLPSGALDLSFGDAGTVAFDPDDEFDHLAGSLVVLPDGRILVGGGVDDHCWRASVLRLNPDGSRDASWQHIPSARIADPGMLCSGSIFANHLAAHPDGRVLAFNGAMARFLADGRPDPTLGVQGVLRDTGVRDTHGVGDTTAGLFPTADDDVITLGSDGNNGGFVLARVLTGPAWAPQSVSATPLAGAARVLWEPPPPIAPRPVDAYLVTASDGVHTALAPDADDRSAVVKGLRPGVTYTFTVQAVTPSGLGPVSAPSSPLTTSRTTRSYGSGWNPVGQVGDGTRSDRSASSTVAGLTGVVSVAAGTHHSLALRDDGTVWAWGWNVLGQLGDGTTTDRLAPVPVPGMTDVVAIAGGYYHSLAVKADGSVWAWGWNGVGQVGDGTRVDRRLPARVVGLSGAKAVSAGAAHSLAVKADGSVWSWGWNALGMLGDGTTVDRVVPVRTVGLPAMTSVAAGWYHSAGLSADGRVWEWGWNGYGQLGTGDTLDSHVPVVAYPGPATAIAAGALHTLILMEDGYLLGWGWNGAGQVGGLADVVLWTEVPQFRDAGPSRVVGMAAGAYHSVAVLEDGSVRAWGWNGYGQLANGSTITPPRPALPVRVNTTAFILTVAAGGLHTIVA